MADNTAASLKDRISDSVKDAMRARDKQRVGALRLITSELKRIEVDSREELDDTGVIAVLDKMAKQRRDSLAQYQDAGREDLAAQEQFELDLLQEFMPAQMSADELAALVSAVISETGATSMQDMGKVMGLLKGKAQGRADMGEVGKLVKAALG